MFERHISYLKSETKFSAVLYSETAETEFCVSRDHVYKLIFEHVSRILNGTSYIFLDYSSISNVCTKQYMFHTSRDQLHNQDIVYKFSNQ
jgi:hypothetical protein